MAGETNVSSVLAREGAIRLDGDVIEFMDSD